MSQYYCHNKPRQGNKPYTFVEIKTDRIVGICDSGYIHNTKPELVKKTIQTRFSSECQHITSFKDADCEGCMHRRGKEDE